MLVSFICEVLYLGKSFKIVFSRKIDRSRSTPSFKILGFCNQISSCYFILIDRKSCIVVSYWLSIYQPGEMCHLFFTEKQNHLFPQVKNGYFTPSQVSFFRKLSHKEALSRMKIWQFMLYPGTKGRRTKHEMKSLLLQPQDSINAFRRRFVNL